MTATPPDEAALALRVEAILDGCPGSTAMAVLAGLLANRIHTSSDRHADRIRAFTQTQDTIITLLKELQS